ncbi:MAG: flavodoxin-dependent (E)-4-hydroxy-3-methylbut-2-enyl-diphosphate synthase, partial [Desulfosudaceae bacterium]
MSFVRKRRQTRQIHVGSVAVGGGAPVAVQSMTSTPTADVAATVAQIHRIQDAGGEIIRVAVPDMEAAAAITAIREQIRIPLIADIHFNWRLAVAAIDAGADGLRLNPGNIGGREKTLRVIEKAAAAGVPIRIGVNSGSVEKDLLATHGGATAEAMAQSALRNIALFEEAGFTDVKISIKASDVERTVESYRRIADRCDYPLHVG